MRKIFSDCLLLHLNPGDVAMFRFLLEAYENMAVFSVLERRPALIKLMFALENRKNVLKMLETISRTVPMRMENWPIKNMDICMEQSGNEDR